MIPTALRKLRLENQTAIPDYLQLARSIEHLINTGELKEGQRLPSTMELVELWGINITRIQRAMNVLVSNGLLQRHPRRGSFVSLKENRPSVGILVGPDMLPEANQFYRLLVAALQAESRKMGLSPRLYNALGASDSPERLRASEDFKYDLRHRSFSAFVLVSMYSESSLQPETNSAFNAQKLPSVRYTAPKPSADVHINYHDFVETSVAHLATTGCRNIAYFPARLHPEYQDRFQGFENAIRSAGLKVPRHAVVSSETMLAPVRRPTVDRCAYENMQKVLLNWERKRYLPDGIVISDDIQARGIIAAIQTSSLFRQTALRLIVLSTTHSELFYPLPTTRYSICVGDIAKAMLDRLSLRMQGQLAPNEPEQIKGVLTEEFR